MEGKESFFSASFSPNRENVHYVENLSTDIVDKQQAHRSYVHNVENLSTAIVEILTGKYNSAELSTEDVDNIVEKCVEVTSHLTTALGCQAFYTGKARSE